MNFLTFQHAVKLIGLLMILGAIMIVFITSKRSGEEVKWLWIKYFVYLVLIALVLLLLTNEYQYYLFLVILLVGSGEMIVVGVRSTQKGRMSLFVLSIVVYGIIAFYFLRAANEGRHDLIVLYTCVVVFDGFSQLFGQLFGKKKMAPRWSPGKTWAGFFGGMVMVVPTIYYMDFSPALRDCFAAAIILSIVAFIGDLLASGYKRLCGVKDFSRLIPGHGGMLDRFDSFIVVVAVNEILRQLHNNY